jgi:hypothetical protein
MSLHALHTPSNTGSNTSGSQTSRRHLGSIPRGARDTARSGGMAHGAESLSPWGGRERPATAAEETVFVERLRQMTARPSQGAITGAPFHRYDITALVTALRHGVTVDEMFRSAPGLRPESIAAAYDHVERIRSDAADAWRSLVVEPTAATLIAVGDRAANVLPATISQLRSLLVRHPDHSLSLAAAIAAIDREIVATGNRALELEYLLTHSANPAEVTRAADLLVGEFRDGLWSLGSFLPPRVGTFVSVRLREMLGEHNSEIDTFADRPRARTAVA